jgi:hypothetical protein
MLYYSVLYLSPPMITPCVTPCEAVTLILSNLEVTTSTSRQLHHNHLKSMTAKSAPPSDDARVQDYLNDKLQVFSDLDSLDSLLVSVQTQQTQLRSQLSASTAAAKSARSAHASHASTLLSEARAFQKTQDSIDRRLLAATTTATTTTTASEAAEQFQAAIEKLRRLDVARGYLELLQRVAGLSGNAREAIALGDAESALKPYAELKALQAGLGRRNDAAEGAAVHLVDYVDGAAGELRREMRRRLATGLEEILEGVKWPGENVDMMGCEEGFATAMRKLLVLQLGEMEVGGGVGGGVEEEVVLLPFEVLVRPLALRFRYHFEAERPTNRVDKPEWFLAHITGLVTSYSGFLMRSVQPVLFGFEDDRIRTRDAVCEFITALLPIVRRKTRNILPRIIEHAQLLSHFIHELIKFDAELRDEFYYAPFGTQGPWKGMTHEVLVVGNGFAGWLKVEKEFALSRYHNILSASDAWVLDYDAVLPAESKPTKSTLRLKDLLENITDSYRPLISFSQRLRFLIDIQIAILDQYHERLTSSVEAFRVLSSSIARAVQGTSKEEVQSLSGLGGLERLCKVYGSAMFLENCMRDWSEDIVYLSLLLVLRTYLSNLPQSSSSSSGQTSNSVPQDPPPRRGHWRGT